MACDYREHHYLVSDDFHSRNEDRLQINSQKLPAVQAGSISGQPFSEYMTGIESRTAQTVIDALPGCI
jgi:hypothetical protein